MRVPSGVPGFDALVQGGLPTGVSIIVQGPAGKEKDAFLFQFVAEGLRTGGSAVVILSSVSPAKYQQQLREAGVKVDEAIAQDRLKFVDWFSYKEESVQDVEQDGPVYRASIDLANVGIAVSRAIASLPRDGEKRAAVEVLSPALSVYDLPMVYGFAQSTKAKLERFGLTSLFVLEKEMHDDRTLSSLHQPFDGVVDIERVREGDELVRKVAVLSLKGTATQSKYVPLDVGRDQVLRASTASERERTLRRQEELISSNPKDPKLWLATARNLRGMGETERALKCVEAALNLDAADADSWRFKAELLDSLGRAAEAAQARARAEHPIPPPPKDDVSTRLLAVVEARLRQNPKDSDALFVKAAALAKIEDFARALEALEALAGVDEAYPGLWVLKAKLHARRGEREKAQGARLQAQDVERRQAAREREAQARTAPPARDVAFECPQCGAAIGEHDAMCPSCGVLFEGYDTPPEPKSAVPPPHPRSEVKRRGLTNGLAREASPRGVGRTNGLVNGTRGRTNGLVNGTRGRTNGLVNGTRGRTNGLVNGTRGRTNGLVNGTRGRTNGLVNGIAALRSGVTNGLTNGSGFTNGLGSPRFARDMRRSRWKLFLIPGVFAALILLPVLTPDLGDTWVRQIDGSFEDWAGVSGYTLAAGGNNTNADLTRVAIQSGTESVSLLVEVSGQILTGGPSPPGLMDSVYVFVDVDRRPGTGYPVQGLGADRLLEIQGHGGEVRRAVAYRFSQSVADVRDWRGWTDPATFPAAASGSRMELAVEWLLLDEDRGPATFLVASLGWNGAVDFADLHLSTRPGHIRAIQRPVAPATIAGANVPLLVLELTAIDVAVPFEGLAVDLLGTAPLSDIATLQLVDGAGAPLSQRVPVDDRVEFTFPSITISPGTPQTFTVTATVSGSSGDTLGAQVPNAQAVSPETTLVTLRTVETAEALGYLRTAPAAPRVDGGFAEWTNDALDGAGEAETRGNPSVDLERFGGVVGTGNLTFHVGLRGPAFAGTVLPVSPTITPTTSPQEPDRDRDSVPDSADLHPDDFDNDGVPDGQEAGDHDGDGSLDYTFGGPDLWLNTTIPNTFDPPYAGRNVTVYVGPTSEPPIIGEDAVRLFVDADNTTATGFYLHGIGADYLVEIRGREGIVSDASLLAHAGSPGTWSWTRTSDVALALGATQLEAGADLPVVPGSTAMYVEVSGWGNAQDSLDEGAVTRGARAPSAAGPDPPQTLDISGNGVFWLLNTNHATETTCTVNKVASSPKGSGPVSTTTLTTGQSACWYADSTTGATIPTGDWEALLDLSLPYRGLVGYGEGSVTTPRYRVWDGSAFGTEASAATAAATIQWVVVKASPTTSDDVIMGVLANDNSLYVQTWNGASWTANWNTAIGDSITRRFDIAYEGSSGDVVVVFGDGTSQLKYRKRASGTWDSSNQNAGTTLADLPYWVRAESRPTNDDIFVAVITNALTIHGLRWVGSTDSWSDQTQMTTNPYVKVQETMDIAFERTSGDAFVLWGDSSNNLKYREFTTSWQTEGNAYASMADSIYWVVAAYDPISTSSKMAVGMLLNNGNFEFGAWDGSSWVTRPTAVAGRDKTERGIDVAFEKDTGKAMYIYDTSASGAQMTWRTWTSSGGFSSATAETGSSGSINTMQLRSDPYSNEIMALYADANSDLFHRAWSGSAWTALGTALETGLSSITTNREAFMFAWVIRPQYDVVFEIWNKDTNSVTETIGSCLDQTAIGDDVRCLVSGVAQKTIASNEVVRLRVSHSSAYGTVRIDYGDSDSTGDSRITIPIPEFEDIAVPMVAILVPAVWIWVRRRARARSRKPAEAHPT